MKKGTLTTLVLFLLCSFMATAQWINQGAWPDGTVLGQMHGVAVDPDGKVWAGNFGTEKFLPPGATDTLTVNTIRVYNPDGSPASFSPVWNIVGPGFNDTLKSNVRGMRPDNNGNILLTLGNQVMYRINYQTGAGMNKVALGIGTSPTAPAVSSTGQIFVGPVVNAGASIKEFDADFNLVGDAVGPFTETGFSRSMECSDDGNTLYFPVYDADKIVIYQRPDELSAFDSVGVILGFACESITFNKTSGNLWIAGGSYNDLPDPVSSYSPNTWYEYNVATNTVVGSLEWDFTIPFNAGERPRALDFSPDGLTAYIGCFGGTGYPLVQKLTYTPPTEYTVTFNVDMGVQAFEGNFPAGATVVVRGSFQSEAGDPGGDWQGNLYEMSDADGDTIYTLTVPFPLSEAGNSFAFKYVIVAPPAGDNWESTPDRPFSLNLPSQNLPKVWFNNDNVYTVVSEVTNTINFTADISGILGVGVGGAFDPALDSLLVMGLDWDNLGKNVVGNRRMFNNDPFNPGIYDASLTVTSGSAAANGAGDSTKWKFKAYPDGRFANTGWETTPDKWHIYQADGSVIDLPTIVPDILPLFGPIGSDVNITITVDMSGATNRYNGLTIPLNELQFVGMRGAADFLGSWASGGNWTPADTTTGNMKVLTNIGGNLWRITVTAPAGQNAGQYAYKFAAMYPGADTINGGSSPLDNENPNDFNHTFVLSDVSPSITLWNNWADITTDVKPIKDLVPNVYELGQNYPNPFNPSTTIKFSVPEAGLVTLRVFNLLGQEVATLLNGEKTAGVYEATFDASTLSSGIYFYTLDTKNFSSTKKMVLLK